jgi:hypothetical protein
VPLTDINGSTIALVNSAAPTSPPGATYTYDPSGNVSINGGNVTSWPFQYQGMEHEITDPANLYFNPSSNVYNPQIQNAVSQVGAQGLGGSSGANPAGPAITPPSGQSGGSTWQKFQNDVRQSEQVEDAANNFSISFSNGEAAPVTLPLGTIAGTVDLLVNLIEDLFSGSENPPIPRQLMHKRHPLYGEILGLDTGLIPTEGPAGNPPAPSATPPPRPCPPVPGPPGILRRNIDLARKHPWWNPLQALYLARRMANGGKWDYKPANDAFGNFNYGATMAAAGYPDQFTLRFAGAYHQLCGTISGDEAGSPLGGYPFGNRPSSEAEVAAGIDYVEMGCDR